MNFKQAYKNANNSIHADRALIDAIHLKAQKNKKAIRYPSYIGLAAAAAVFALVFSNLGIQEKDTQKPETYIAKGGLTATRSVDIGQADIKSENTMDTTLKKQVEGEYSSKTNDNNDAVLKSESVETEVDNSTINEADILEKTENQDLGVTTENYGISMAGLYDATPYENTKSLSKEQYFEYIGTDITKMAQIPDDMQFEAFNTAELTIDADGNITDDRVMFIAYNENKERSITIEVTKLKSRERVLGDNEVSDTVKTFEFENGGLTYSVTAFNITDTELSGLLSSLGQ